jgi:hypothetical protein
MGYCTLEQVKEYVDIKTTETDKDSLINTLIASSQAFIEEYCNRKFEKSVETEYHEGGSNKIFVKKYPIFASPAPQIWDSWDRLYASTDLILATDYFIDYDKGIISFDYEVGGSPGAVKVVYTGGYKSYLIPLPVSQACIELVARKLKEGPSGGLGVPSRALPGGGNVTFVIDALLPQTKIALDLYKI